MEFRLASSRLNVMLKSLVIHEGTEYGLIQNPDGQKLAILGEVGAPVLEDFDGENTEFNLDILKLCPLNQRNAASLRRRLPWLQPQLLGLKTSAGTGDRLGIATPGHVRAVRKCRGKIAPIFAQQSIREMVRTGRNPHQVMDDAMWGIFEEGWQSGAGADADHLKTSDDIDICLKAGFTFFTLDPGQYVDNHAMTADQAELEQKLKALPSYLHPDASGLSGKAFDVEGHRVSITQHRLCLAAVKYGQALHQIKALYDYLCKNSKDRVFEVEISMDETDLPTSPAEHIYIASELRRLGVQWVSFAPRFVGKFEKGVDYIGDLRQFGAQLEVHAAIARLYGPYKLSLHSGSDKFKIYTLFMNHTRGLAHLKTAGTSYLEALRIIADHDISLFREIYIFARQQFESEKRTYHISAKLNRAPSPGEVADGGVLLDQFDARQILHVTFGSVLTSKTRGGKHIFYDRIMHILNQYREQYFNDLETHFLHHLEPFSTEIKSGRNGN